MTPRMRQFALYGTLLATGLAAFFAPPQEQAVKPANEDDGGALNRRAGPAGLLPAPATAIMAMTPKKRTALSALPKDLFHIEAPPPVFADAETVQAPPRAPPLPYVYMGKSIGQGQITVFLTRDEKPYVAKLGDVLDDQYRIDAINPPLLEFTYLPLAQKQTLQIGAVR